MKKLLLSAAFVLLSFSVQAQGLKSWLPAFDGGPVKGLKAGPGMKRVGADALKKNAAASAAATAPEGEKREFLVMDSEPVSELQDQNGNDVLYPRVRKQELIFADGGKVYVPNMFLTSVLDPSWLEGSIDGDGNIVIEPNQVVGTYSEPELGMSNDFIVSLVDTSTGEYQPGSGPITLYFDDGAYCLPEDQFLGVFRVDEMPFLPFPIYTLYTSLCNLAYGELSTLGEPVKYDYFYDEMYPSPAAGRKGTVEVYSQDGLYVSTSLLPAYPDAMMMLEDIGTGSLTLYATTVVDDDALVSGFAPSGQEGYYNTVPFVDFVYNPADGSYKVPAEYMLGDFFVDPLEGTGNFSCMYSNLSLVPATVTAIGGAGVKDGAGVVSTEYYDLSGRRTDGAAKGVGIKVEKYADGTSKAVKVLR